MTVRSFHILAVGLMALSLAACADRDPVQLGGPEQTCDGLCGLIHRLFDLDEPPPPAAPVASRPKPTRTPPGRSHARVGRAERRLAHRPARVAAVQVQAVPVAAEPVPTTVATPDITPVRSGQTDIMPGSPGIAPPWFEPWVGEPR